MAILGFEGALIFAFISVAYNLVMTIKLLYNAIADVEFKKNSTIKEKIFSLFNIKENKLILNLLSCALMGIGSLLLFFWFSESFAPTIGWNGFLGSLFLVINNITATVLTFMNRIKASIFGKIINVFFSILALSTFFFFLNKISAQTAFSLPGFLEWIILAPTIGYAMFQALLFSPSSYFFPVYIIIPLCVPIKFLKEKEDQTDKEETKTKKKGQKKTKVALEEKSSKSVFLEDIQKDVEARPSGFAGVKKFLDNGSKGIYSLLFIFLLVFQLLGTGVMNSFSPYISSNYQPLLEKRNDFEFGVTINTVTYNSIIPGDYEEYFNEELELLRELGVTTVRLDVTYEIINENSTILQDITDELRFNGFKVMLATYGHYFPTWQFSNVSFSTYSETMHNQSRDLIELCNPEFLLIYPEPLSFAPYYLSEETTANDWINAINNTANYLHALTNDTKIGINLVINEDHPNIINMLFEPLWENTTLDLIGLDLYPLRSKYLNLDGYLEKMTNNSKELWLTEFGLSAVMFGERRQAGAIERMLEICVNNEQIKGFVYFTLIDYSPAINTLGLVAESGHVKRAFTKYKEIIQDVTS
ncbi:MAG: hypothetical protein KAS63_06725 [Candidatus Heimdallarchaeota archaeon]|nr:hypothetical protein [Candidatus Heimdallarchaeota archaeon]MCK4955038.1 hypothetical protein [Candidatus Heimdallarchaeota archaeon]